MAAQREAKRRRGVERGFIARLRGYVSNQIFESQSSFASETDNVSKHRQWAGKKPLRITKRYSVDAKYSRLL